MVRYWSAVTCVTKSIVEYQNEIRTCLDLLDVSCWVWIAHGRFQQSNAFAAKIVQCSLDARNSIDTTSRVLSDKKAQLLTGDAALKMVAREIWHEEAHRVFAGTSHP